MKEYLDWLALEETVEQKYVLWSGWQLNSSSSKTSLKNLLLIYCGRRNARFSDFGELALCPPPVFEKSVSRVERGMSKQLGGRSATKS